MKDKLLKQWRNFLILICLLLLSVSFVFSQTADKSKYRTSKTESELMQLERDIGDANVRRDKAFFDRVEANEFIFTDSSGGTTTKAEDVSSLDKAAGEFKLISYAADEMKVFDYGKTAVVTGRVTTTLKSKDREIVNKIRFTDVFVKRGGRWQIVAGHSSRIREPQK